jgi:prepilin-type N-terminal cleavage/methylation domain-containing protein
MNTFARHCLRHVRGIQRGFSLVEMMACVSIIGIIAFLAIPSITRMRSDSERNLAISRAEALNLAQATFIQVKGRSQAEVTWRAAGNDIARYALLRDYLAYAEASLSLYLPAGYTATFPTTTTNMTKVTLKAPDNSTVAY